MKTSRTFAVLAALLFAAMATGCASAMAKGPDRVNVVTEPPGALVCLDGVPMGVTPVAILIPRGSEGLLQFEKAGYLRATRDLDKVANGWFLGNLAYLIIGPEAVVLGFAIDLIQSNQGKYSTDTVYVDLIPIPVSDSLVRLEER